MDVVMVMSPALLLLLLLLLALLESSLLNPRCWSAGLHHRHHWSWRTHVMPSTHGLFCASAPPWYSPPHASSARAFAGKHLPCEVPGELARQKFIVPELQSGFDQHCWKAAVSLCQRLMSAAASDADMAEIAVAAAADVASLRAEVCVDVSSSSRHASNQGDLRVTLMGPAGTSAAVTPPNLDAAVSTSAFRNLLACE
jgi:hypothetical protein